MTEMVTVEAEVVDTIKQEGAPLIDRAKAIARSIVGAETYKQAGEFMLAIKAHRKKISEKLGPPKQAAHAAWSKLCALEKELDTPYANAEAEVKNGMSAYLRDEEQRRKQAEEEMRAKLRKDEEERRLNQAVRLEESGKKEEAAAVLDKPIVTPAVTYAAPEKVQGEQRKKVWKFRVVDESLVPREFLVVDEKKIRAQVVAFKGNTKIAGVEVWEDFEIGGRV